MFVNYIFSEKIVLLEHWAVGIIYSGTEQSPEYRIIFSKTTDFTSSACLRISYTSNI